MNAWKIAKTAIYPIAGTLIIVFSSFALEHAVTLVGVIMSVYATERVIVSIYKKTVLREDNELFEGLVLALLAAVLLFTDGNDLAKVCVIWAIWSILRETEEIKECLFENFYKRAVFPVQIVNYVHCFESAVVIALSVSMLLSPSVKTAHAHIILLGLELILEIGFPIAVLLSEKTHLKKEKNDAA